MRFRARFIEYVVVLLLVPGIAGSRAQTAARPDLASVTNSGVWQAFNRQPETLKEGERVIARLDERAGDGAAWLAGSNFANGTLEVELRGKDQFQRSFIGLAFHSVDDRIYEAVYFRPFNFRSEDPVRRIHAVQYISHPESTWQKLRSEQPGKFEQPVRPVPDPNGWFRARIEVTSDRVRVFVDGAAEPCLDVPRLSGRNGGRVGLWVGNGSGGDFADLRLLPGDTPK